MNSMKTVFLFVLAALALVACAASKPAWTGDPELARKLTVNMPDAEVRKLLGEPTLIGENDLGGQKTVWWDYDGTKNVRVIMNDGKVFSVVLGRATILEGSVSDL